MENGWKEKLCLEFLVGIVQSLTSTNVECATDNFRQLPIDKANSG
jgi:hypothetical protein